MLGLLFSFFQLNGWEELTNQGVYLTGEGSNVAGSFLYVLTLSHLVHLIGGLIALLVTAINAKRNKYSAENYLGLEITSIYWHFLSILWIYLFCFLEYL
jgi:cytochrome c oxidase subunit 3